MRAAESTGARWLCAFVLAGFLSFVLLPTAAEAHKGSSNPIASSYLAKLKAVPAGTEARVVGGDLGMWLRVDPRETVTVLDYRGAPYLRFDRSGVHVNTNSPMYYLNQPTPLTPPARLTPRTAPRWVQASFGHDYVWHEGRLHALAAVALAPGHSVVGSWRIPLVVNGSPSAISGALLHANDPSIVWFWPIAVVLLCLWAVSRLRIRRLDQLVAHVLGLSALAAIVVLAAGHELHGEPFVSPGQEIVLGVVLAFVAALVVQILWKGPGDVSLILILVAALWAGIQFLPTLLHGFVLMAVPTFLARAATVTCLCCAPGLILLLFGFRLTDTPEQGDEVRGPDLDRELSEEDFDRWDSA